MTATTMPTLAPTESPASWQGSPARYSPEASSRRAPTLGNRWNSAFLFHEQYLTARSNNNSHAGERAFPQHILSHLTASDPHAGEVPLEQLSHHREGVGLHLPIDPHQSPHCVCILDDSLCEGLSIAHIMWRTEHGISASVEQLCSLGRKAPRKATPSALSLGPPLPPSVL